MKKKIIWCVQQVIAAGNIQRILTTNFIKGGGCVSVGRAVASMTRSTRFESSHRQKNIFILNLCLLSTVYRKDENR